jgi:hypothetical protein
VLFEQGTSILTQILALNAKKAGYPKRVYIILAKNMFQICKANEYAQQN